MELTSSLEELTGVGPAIAKDLATLGLHTVGDLLQYYPRTYNDYSVVTPIRALRPGTVTIEAEINQLRGRYVRRGMHITEAVVSDKTDSVKLIWFNQPYREKSLQKNIRYFFSGQFGLHYRTMSIISPTSEKVSDFPVHTARIVPVYSENKQVSSSQLRKLLRQAITQIQLSETLPRTICQQHKLLSRHQAVKIMHFPTSSDEVAAAQYRLGFEEVFSLTLAALLNKQANQLDDALAVPFNKDLAQRFVKALPFNLTNDQRRVVWQIYQDLSRKVPMNRLVEGDVGSGKTVVATMAALMAMEQNFQVAFMAPTELLARQHAETIHTMLEPLGFAGRVSLLTGSMSKTRRQIALRHIKDGQVRFIIGTHALIEDVVKLPRLGLAIVDEQHRFGVEQRKKLQAKAGHAVHVLNMTATPIPRSLALTLYGELDISLLQEKPKNRKPILTTIVSSTQRDALYSKIDSEIEKGRQVFVVCPLVSESTTLEHVRSASEVYQELSKNQLKHRRLGLLYGKLKSEDKARVMQQFAEGELDVLVATTVVEVGVDVPNATVMIVENAERFGLAQLHQLRGRVGRSQHQGYCYLLTQSQPITKRLRALASSQNGFRLAELDLELRGPGAIYGIMQHGQLDLRIAKLTDTKLIADARQSAQDFIDHQENLLHYKELADRVQKLRVITNLN